MIIIAVDPGADGAVTLLPIYSFKSVVVLPFKYNSLTDIFQYIQAEALQYEDTQPYLPQSGNRSSLVHPYLSEVGERSRLVTASKPTIPPIDISPKQRNTQMELWLEDPAYIPKDGKFSLRKLGERIGEWKGIAAALNLIPQLVSPKTWQSALDIKVKGNKNVSKEFAQKAFPFLTKRNKGNILKSESAITLSTADSLLIALYAYTLYTPRDRMPHSLKSLLPMKHVPPRKPSRRPPTKPIRKVAGPPQFKPR
jgi:hypothetical protein